MTYTTSCLPRVVYPFRMVTTVLALLLSFVVLPGLLSAQVTDPVKTYSIPADDAAQSLKRFMEQAGVQLLYANEQVEGVRTQSVEGEFTATGALERLLQDTGLEVTRHERTGALAVKRAGDPNGARAVAAMRQRPERSTTRVTEDGTVVMEEVQVTGSRMALNTGEIPVQPVLTFTAQDIERTGASSLGDLFQYIPSLTSSSSGLGFEYTNGGTLSSFVGTDTVRTSAQLRGGTGSGTLLLVDGKRVPRSGQRGGTPTFDLGGIPLSAIERVEVLLDGASAIYGNDAIYGVINVILKKSYSGTEIRLTYDNTFDKDAAARTASLTHGFASGKWSGLFTLSASDNNVMVAADRRLTSTYDRRLFGGSQTFSAPTSAFQGNGTLSVASGVLPGIGTQFVSIPDGALGANLTVADFAAAPPVLFGQTPEDRNIGSLNKSRSAFARLGYEISTQLELSAMVRHGETSADDMGVYRRALNITLPAGYPGNPFGIPVRLSKTFYDLPKLFTGADATNTEIGLSAKGKFARDWRWDVSANYLRGTNERRPPRLPGAGNQIGAANFRGPLLNAAIAGGRRPNLIYDSQTQSPLSATELDEFWVNQFPSVTDDLFEDWTYTAVADGPLFSLPAGQVRAVTGIEYRLETYDSPNVATFVAWNAIPKRKVQAAFAEVRVPLVAPQQDWFLVHQLDLNLAARSEEYSDVKDGQVITPRYGVAWRPLPSLLLRGSYGEGFLVPPLGNILQVEFSSEGGTPNSAIWRDPLRGDTIPVGHRFTTTSGGNPDLKPQRSENRTYGVVWEVPKLTGLSLSFDYFDNRYVDRFGGVGVLAERILYAPETIVRGPNLPTDPAGWAGQIVSIDQRVINIATARVTGYNFGARWNRSTPWGNLTLSSSGEKILLDEARVVPGAVPTASTHKKFRPMRITSALFWSRGAWDAGVTHIYGGRYWVNSTNQTLSPSRWTDDVMRFDVNASYDFGKNKTFGERGDSWWRRALHDTKWSATIINVANTEPPIDARGLFSSSVIDPRLRRYVIDFTKRF